MGFVTSVTNGIAVNIVVEKGLDQIIILKITYLYVPWLARKPKYIIYSVLRNRSTMAANQIFRTWDKFRNNTGTTIEIEVF